MPEEHLINIESKLTYLEDTVQELNQTVYQQQKQIDQLQALCESLVTHMRALSEAASEENTGVERPPHY
jgi:SlyX protein